MSVRYIGKKNLYDLVKRLSQDENFPLCKDFIYKRFRGVEQLEGYGYSVGCQFQGAWIRITHIYEINGMIYRRENIYAHPKDGIYDYQSSREKLLGCDL